jgi:F-type H+-transporting ATPase subunit a
MKTRTKVLLFFAGVIALAIILYAIFGSSGKNNSFQPQEEFRLHAWIPIHIAGIDLSITRAVLYLFLASVLTCGTMIYIGRRMQDRPNKVQTAVEVAYDLAANNITRGNLENPKLARRWFSFIATLFFFIWFSNMLGYIPLPTSHEKINIFGAHLPAFTIYAATANISIPLALTLVVFIVYNEEGIRAKGLIGYFKGFVPAGVEGAAAVPIFFIEVISNLVRIISLSVRLFANILAGHLLILFMAGGLVVLLGLAPLGVFTLLMAIPFFLFEVGLVATLQAFIFATLTAIYIGGAVSAEH